MRSSSFILLLVIAAAACTWSGCGTTSSGLDGLGQVIDAVSDPADAPSAPEDATGGAEIELRPDVVAESVTVRWPGAKKVIADFLNFDDPDVILGTVTLVIPTQMSGSVTGLPAGTRGFWSVRLYADDADSPVLLITTGSSGLVVIPAGSNASTGLTLPATKPILTVLEPSSGQTINATPVTFRVEVKDLGAGTPALVLTDNDKLVTVLPTVTGDTINGRIATWVIPQENGDHEMVLTATSTSHVDAANSGISTVTRKYKVDTEFGDLAGKVSTFISQDSVYVSGFGWCAPQVTLTIPAGATKATFQVALTKGVGDYINVDGELDLVTHLLDGNWNKVVVVEGGVGGALAHPTGSCAVSHAVNPHRLTLTNLVIAGDGATYTVPDFAVTLSASNPL